MRDKVSLFGSRKTSDRNRAYQIVLHFVQTRLRGPDLPASRFVVHESRLNSFSLFDDLAYHSTPNLNTGPCDSYSN